MTRSGLGVGVWVVPFVLVLGCDKGGSGGSPPAPVASETPAVVSAPVASASAPAAPSGSAAAPDRAQHPRHGGVAADLFRATYDLELTGPQRDALDKLEPALTAGDDGVRTALKAFRADVIAGIKAGKIDPTKTSADDAAIDKAVADHQAKEATALDALHALLQPGERAKVVAAVHERQARREARMALWMKDKDGDGGAPDWAKRRLDRLTADLTLDDGQQKQVAALLAKANDFPNAAAMQQRVDDAKKRVEALLTAFTADAFDGKKADLTLLPGKTAHEPMDHMVSFFTQLLPILHPDQRDKLAASMDRPFGAHEDADGGTMALPARGPLDDMAFPFVEPGEYRMNRPGGY